MIVVGVDGSATALNAVRWAAREAERRDVPLMLLHACFVPSPAPYTPVRLPRSYGDALLDQGRDWLSEARTVAQDAATVPIRTALRAGLPADQLIRASGAAELVVLGSRGLGGLTGLLLGSAAVAVTTHSRCPVVVIRGVVPDEGPVVVGVDDPAVSDPAVDFAFEAAAARAVPLLAVHTWSGAGLVATLTTVLTPGRGHAADEERRLLADRLSSWQARYPEVEVRLEVFESRPADGLLKAAEGAQLLVVGSRGHGGFAGAGLGSTSQRLLHHAECPVAVVRPAP